LGLSCTFGNLFEWEVLLGKDEEAGARFLEALKRRGLTVGRVMELFPGYRYIFLCGGEETARIVEDMPQIATLYICRVYLYRAEDGLRMGYVNMENLLKVFGRYLSRETRGELMELGLKVRSAAEEVRRR
jgi:hypothetical protein